MSDTTDLLQTDRASGAESADVPTSTAARKRKPAGLPSMVLPELQTLASQLGISGTGRMRKSELIAAIQDHQTGSARPARAAKAAAAPPAATAPAAEPVATAPVAAAVTAPARRERAPRRAIRAAGEAAPAESAAGTGSAEAGTAPVREQQPTLDDAAAALTAPAQRRAESAEPADSADSQDPSGQDRNRDGRPDRQRDRGDRPERSDRPDRPDRQRDRQNRQGQNNSNGGNNNGGQTERQERPANQGNQDRPERQQGNQDRQQGNQDRPERQQGNPDRQNQDRQNQGNQDRQQGGQNSYANQGGGFEDDLDGSRRGRRGRFRERNRSGRNNARGERFTPNEVEPTISDDDVLVPVAGIVDIHDNYAFVRTSGYLPGPNDVYVSLAQVRSNGLRRGDAVTGAVTAAARGRAREKYNPLVRLDTVNGLDPEKAAQPGRVHQADPALPAGAAAARDRAAHPHHPGHRPGHADRQGPARR